MRLYSIRTFFSYIGDTIKSGDLYGKQITMTYKGDDSFKTTYGGIISLFIKIILLIQAGVLFAVIINKGDTKKDLNTTVKDISNDKTKHFIGQGTFAFAVDFQDLVTGANLLMDSTYFELSMQNVFVTRYPNSSITFTAREIPYDQCGQNFKFVTDQNQYNRIGLARYACPTSTDYYISSDFFGDEFANLQIDVKKCTNTTENGNH